MKIFKKVFFMVICLVSFAILVACNASNDELIKDDTKINVFFDTSGGSEVAKQLINQNGLVSKPEDPTKAGYEFDGWYKDNAYEVPWNFLVDVVTEDITIYGSFYASLLTALDLGKDLEHNQVSTEK